VPLTARLSGKWEDVSNEFDRRVKADFPIGIPVEKMGAELQRQGFRDRIGALQLKPSMRPCGARTTASAIKPHMFIGTQTAKAA
jgi:hypothetical protein